MKTLIKLFGILSLMIVLYGCGDSHYYASRPYGYYNDNYAYNRPYNYNPAGYIRDYDDHKYGVYYGDHVKQNEFNEHHDRDRHNE